MTEMSFNELKEQVCLRLLRNPPLPLKGPAGPVGETGVPGPQGPQGPQGPSGRSIMGPAV